VCEHGRRRAQCKECGGSQICVHGRQKHSCNACKPSRRKIVDEGKVKGPV
jgi:hypothetical protein